MTIVLTRSATVRDIEGHSLLIEELGQTISRDRAHEADAVARHAALARAASAGHSSGFLVQVQRAVIRPWRRELATGADSGRTVGSAGSFDLIALRELVDGNPIR
jgi:hypothetical protein